MVKVELVYLAKEGPGFFLELSLPTGATVGEALSQSKIYELHPETKSLAVGIYAQLVTEDRVLRDGDRIELYRPLLIDPKEKRRQVAKVKKKLKQ